MFLKQFIEYATNKYKDRYVDESKYLNEDGTIFVFETTDRLFHVLTIERGTNKIIEL